MLAAGKCEENDKQGFTIPIHEYQIKESKKQRRSCIFVVGIAVVAALVEI